MNKLLLFALLIAIPFASKAWKADTAITYSQTPVGNTVSGGTIMATEMALPYYPFDYKLDTSTNELLLVLRKRNDNGVFKKQGLLCAFDLNAKKARWFREIQGDQFRYEYTRNSIVRVDQFETVGYSRTDGKKKWIIPGGAILIDDKNGIAISPVGRGVDLNTGATRWNSKYANQYGWRDVYYADDTAILVSGAGVKKVNLANGKGWAYQAKTSYGNLGSAAAIGAAGVVLGAVGGALAGGAVGAAVPGGSTTLTGLCSNILTEDGHIYSASRQDIVCLSDNGNIVWTNPLPKKQTAKSALWLSGDTLFMLNLAYGYMESLLVDKGVPYIAAFDKRTGKQFFFQELSNKEGVRSYCKRANNLFIHTGGKVHKYDLGDGHQLIEHLTAYTAFEKNPFIERGYHYFVKMANGGFKPLSQIYPDDEFITSDNDDTVTRVSNNLQVIGVVEEKVWIEYAKSGKYVLARSENKTVLLKDGKELAAFDFSNGKLAGHFIFNVKDEHLRIVDIQNM